MLYRNDTRASVEYQTFILNPDGSVAKENKRKRNLILDQGLDQISGGTWVSRFTNCVVGTGTDPVKRDSASVTFTRAGTTVTASSNFFEAADVGRLLKFDSGEEMKIVSFTSATEVTVDTSGALPASEGTIWYVNRTGLQTEVKRTSTTSTDTGANGTTFSVDTVEFKRTFIFSAEAGPVTYREIGWSSSASAGGNLFGMDLIPGAGDSLLTGQQYKVVVRLFLKFSVTSPQAVPDVGNNGFDTAGTLMIESLHLALMQVSPGFASTGGGLEPSMPKTVGLARSNWSQNSSISTSNAEFSSVSYVDATASAYTNGTFRKDFTAVFGVSSSNGTIYGVSLSPQGEANRRTTTVKFTTPQTKTSDYRLTFVWRMTWGRILTN